jgi:hypothetical protein
MSAAWQQHDVYDPTPEDIESACVRIRAGWSQRVRRRRSGKSRREGGVPTQVTTAQPLDGRRSASPNFLEDF